jgi:hypothetical protein
MSVFSASGTSYPFRRTASSTRGRRVAHAWTRTRTPDRPNRRLAAVRQRAMQRLAQHLGATWRLVDTPHADLASPEHAGFLIFGPGGVFAVTVIDQGRRRAMIAGDVIQLPGGRRPPHVARARRYARKARTALSEVVGATVPVIPVLALVGSGPMSAHGLPVGCLLVNYRELDRLLQSIGEKIAATTAQKLADIAEHPTTWPT